MIPDEEAQLQLETFVPMLTQMLRVKQPLSTAPTFTPRNAFEQVQLYENGVTRRLYIYVGSAWRFVALT